MKLPAVAVALGLGLLLQNAPDETARLNAWFEARFEEQLAFSPIRQTFLGRNESGKDSDLWADVKAKIDGLRKKGAIDQARADKMLADARAALIGPFRGAYEELITWQKQDRANAPEQASGVSSLPNGGAFYNQRLAASTTTMLTADEIHRIGLDEVARIRRDMEAIRNEVGFAGDLAAFFRELRASKDNPRHYYPDTDEGRQAYIRDATAAIEKIKAVLPKYFGILPKADLVVKRVEPFREQPGAAQHYFPGTPDGSRPGVYYAHLADMKAMPKHELDRNGSRARCPARGPLCPTAQACGLWPVACSPPALDAREAPP